MNETAKLTTLPNGLTRMTGAKPSLPDELARKIGAKPPLPGEDTPEPDAMLDWALRYAAQGLHVFPCETYIGLPSVDQWHAIATTKTCQLVKWWTENPDADIAVVPDRSGHLVILAVGDEGQDSFEALEGKYGELQPEFIFESKRRNATQYWFSGTAFSSSHLIGKELFVFGPGRFLFLPPSTSRVEPEFPK